MKTIFKLIFFSFMLNFAVGIMIQAVPAFSYYEGTTAGIPYEGGKLEQQASEFNRSVRPTGDIEDQSDAFDRLLDKTGLGVIKKVIKVVDNYMFGFINILRIVFSPALGSAMSSLLFDGMKFAIVIGYALGVFWLWTGKNPVGEQ